MSREIQIRRATPDDAEAIGRIFDTPRAVAGTLQIPHMSVEFRRKRLADADEHTYPLAAVVDGEVVGFGHGSGIAISPTRIVTNAHVVESAVKYPNNVALGVVPSEGQKSYAGKLIAIDDWPVPRLRLNFNA